MNYTIEYTDINLQFISDKIKAFLRINHTSLNWFLQGVLK